MSNNSTAFSLASFQQEPDTILNKLGNFIQTALLFFIVFFIFWPYFSIYGNARDYLICATHRDHVWIVEHNPWIMSPLDPEVQDAQLPPFSFITEKKPFAKTYYHCRTIRQAEDWLLEHGYKVTKQKLYIDYQSDTVEKWFAIREGKEGIHSIVSIAIDYGDGDIYLYPYRTPTQNPGINIDRFEQIAYQGRYFRHGWTSVDHIASHAWGRTFIGDPDGTRKYEPDPFSNHLILAKEFCEHLDWAKEIQARKEQKENLRKYEEELGAQKQTEQAPAHKKEPSAYELWLKRQEEHRN